MKNTPLDKNSNLGFPRVGAVIYEISKTTSYHLANHFADSTHSQRYHNITAL